MMDESFDDGTYYSTLNELCSSTSQDLSREINDDNIDEVEEEEDDLPLGHYLETSDGDKEDSSPINCNIIEKSGFVNREISSPSSSFSSFLVNTNNVVPSEEHLNINNSKDDIVYVDVEGTEGQLINSNRKETDEIGVFQKLQNTMRNIVNLNNFSSSSSVPSTSNINNDVNDNMNYYDSSEYTTQPLFSPHQNEEPENQIISSTGINNNNNVIVDDEDDEEVQILRVDESNVIQREQTQEDLFTELQEQFFDDDQISQMLYASRAVPNLFGPRRLPPRGKRKSECIKDKSKCNVCAQDCTTCTVMASIKTPKNESNNGVVMLEKEDETIEIVKKYISNSIQEAHLAEKVSKYFEKDDSSHDKIVSVLFSMLCCPICCRHYVRNASAPYVNTPPKQEKTKDEHEITPPDNSSSKDISSLFNKRRKKNDEKIKGKKTIQVTRQQKMYPSQEDIKIPTLDNNDLTNDVVVAPCGHVYCHNCYLTIAGKYGKCSICRRRLTPSKSTPLFL